jgi:curved DNA-binding protein CbpA
MADAFRVGPVLRVDGEACMALAASGETGSGRVPTLAPGLDASRLPLTPAEGFLLSRIDGRTPWRLLREIGGLPASDVDRCLERWLAEGVVVVANAGSPPPAANPVAATPGGVEEEKPSAAIPVTSGLPPLAVDPSLDIPVAAQRSLLAFEARLSLPYHEVLGISADADLRAVKRAYFELSREDHPDRWFRRNIGPFGPRVERVFRRVLEAYELLSDPTTRAEIERAMRETVLQIETPVAQPDEGPSAPSVAESSVTEARAEIPRHERPFRLPHVHATQLRALAERRTRARRFFEAGMKAFAEERWIEAAGSVRLAIAFDPTNEAIRESFVDVQRRAHDERAKQLVREAKASLDLGNARDALRLYEEVLLFAPHDPDANHTAARLGFLLGEDLRRAKECAQRACELRPDLAVHRRTLGMIYAAAGLAANARRELTAALEIDPADAEAKEALRGLGRR